MMLYRITQCLGFISFFLVDSAGDYAVQGYDGRDALDNHYHGAEAQEQEDQWAAYENLAGCAG